ncbi:MAG: hypothetical protein U5K43_05910 [Halofilum sp. (in: g-proteobacteria)]|nr:hypothetical protein [Halofilum sp. (in: g-proteobacteria)]
MAVNVVFTGLVLDADGERIEFVCGDPELLCDDPADPGTTRPRARSTSWTTRVTRASPSATTPSCRPDAMSGSARSTPPTRHRRRPAPRISCSRTNRSARPRHPSRFPDRPQAGQRLRRPRRRSANLTIEFELRKPVTLTGNGRYTLRPATAALVDNSDAGHLFGEITSAHAQENCPEGLELLGRRGPHRRPRGVTSTRAPARRPVISAAHRRPVRQRHGAPRPGGRRLRLRDRVPARRRRGTRSSCNPTADDEDVGDDQVADRRDRRRERRTGTAEDGAGFRIRRSRASSLRDAGRRGFACAAEAAGNGVGRRPVSGRRPAPA